MFRFEWLTPRFEMDAGAEIPGVESIPAAEGSEIPSSEPSETGAETPVAADPEKQNNFEKAFAKRLADAQSKWEKETSEKYKDYDVHVKASQFLQKQSGINDVMTLKEQLELSELQERAESQNLTVEEQRRQDRLEELEARVAAAEAEKATAAETQQKLEAAAQWEKTYFEGLNEFVKDKGIESEALNKFMIENQLMINPDDMNKSFEIAMKAMKYDDVLKASEEAEKNGMKKFLQSKGSIPTIQGSKGQGTTISAAPKTFAEARQRAMQRDFYTQS